MLKFKSIEGQGFGSLIEPFIYKFTEPGLKIIKGRNGSGKTSSIALLYWTLYGKLLKDKSDPITWKHLRPRDWKGTYGSVVFKNDNGKIEVIRCKKFKGDIQGARGDDGLYLVINSKLQTMYSDKRAIQEAITKELGMSSELFINSVMFGQSMKRIINQSGPMQSKVFEEAFDAQFVNIAKKTAEDKLNQLRIELSDLTHMNNSTKLKISNTKLKISKNKDFVLQFETNKKSRIKLILNDIKESNSDISKLTFVNVKNKKLKLLGKIKTTEKSKKLFDNNESEINRERTKLKQLFIEFKNIEDICSNCGAQLNKKRITKVRDSNIDKRIIITDIIIELENNSFKYNKKKLKSLQKELSSIRTKDELYNRNLELKERLERKNKSRLITIETIKDEELPKSIDSSLRTNLTLLRKQKKSNKLELSKIKEEIELTSWCIKEPLSNKGIKAYIFESQLQKVNDVLINMAEVLPFRIEFGIDTDTKSKKFYTLIEMGKGIVNYNDLSGGEKQLVNIAIAFAIHDVIAQDINTLFMDEVFESLDKENIEIVGDMILMKSIDKEILLVTHTDFYPTGSTIINYSKNKKGVTKIT